MATMRPLITEKSMMLAQKGWYSFIVTAFRRKEDIAKEIGKLYRDWETNPDMLIPPMPTRYIFL